MAKVQALFMLLAAVSGQAAPGPEPPRLRLGDNVRPTRYSLDLTLDPERDDFSGVIAISMSGWARRPA